MRSRLLLAVAGNLVLALLPSVAAAHLVTTGLGPLYDGFSHFVLTPEDLVPVLALALLVGMRGPAHGRRSLFVLPASWLLGGVVGLTIQVNVSPVLTAIPFLLLGGLVAADARLPLGVTTMLAALLGLFQGCVNEAVSSQPGLGLLGLLGTIPAVFTVVALAASVVAQLRSAWARVVVRVVGSWIAATGMLLFGWSFRSGA